MKGLTYLLFIITTTTTTAVGQRKIALSLQVAPIYGHDDSQIRTGGLPNQPPATQITAASNGLSYSVGLSLRYAFTPRWSLTSGLWATHTLTAKTNFVQDGVPYTFQYGYNHPLSHAYKAPLLVNYQVTTHRLSPYVSLGATFNFRATSYVDLSGSGEYVALKVGKPVVVIPYVGLGLVYQLSPHWSVLAQPAFQYNLQARPSYDYYHSYQVSWQTQVMYRF